MKKRKLSFVQDMEVTVLLEEVDQTLGVGGLRWNISNEQDIKRSKAMPG